MKVLIVDDHEIVREGLRAGLEGDERYVVIGGAPNARKALEVARRTQPDAAIVDFCLPDMAGDLLCRELIALLPRLGVVILSSYLTDETVRRSVEGGASEYVTKAAGLPELRAALERVRTQGARLRDPASVPGIVQSLDDLVSARSDGHQLTPQQARVLEMMVEGLTYQEIAERLFISRSTVRFHIHNLKVKFGAGTRAELIAHSIRAGLGLRPADEAAGP
jgi:two-component system response regulator DevR